jgi:SAM-dependent methyltransferase
MSKQHLNDKHCIRCGRTDPTPYLRRHWKKLLPYNGAGEPIKSAAIVDIGCGNGRNSKFLKTEGYKNGVAFDMVNDYGFKITLGRDNFPLFAGGVDVVLANYVFMFLSVKERAHLIKEIKRIAKTGCRIIVELYPAKDSFAVNDAECELLKLELIKQLGWNLERESTHRFIARKGR